MLLRRNPSPLSIPIIIRPKKKMKNGRIVSDKSLEFYLMGLDEK
jgi:hypothetical protein